MDCFPHSHHTHHWEITRQCPLNQWGAPASSIKIMIQYDCCNHMKLYYIWQWCFSQNSSLDVVRVVFDLPITSEIILLQTDNYILDISYRVLECVSHLAPSMNNILKCNEHQKRQKWAISQWKCMIILQYLWILIINSTLLWNGMSPIYNKYICNAVEYGI